ncbi:hypothetical protein ACKWTF_007430 [Chironomus riparius]
MFLSYEEVCFIALHTLLCIIPLSHSKLYRLPNDHDFNRININSANSLPYYLKVPTNVTAIEGSNVILSCHIENLGDKMVFWIRNTDLQILTAGLATFSSDTRFRVNHENTIDEKDWSLLITNVRLEDASTYECQINTEVKMKLNINLTVKEYVEMMEMDSPFLPNYGAAIDGKNLNVLKRGQTITLTCKVLTEHENSNKHSSQIDWMKDEELVSLKTRNGGISINTVWSGKSGSSKLTLSELQENDEGNYSCTSNGFVSDAVTVRIITGIEEKFDQLVTTENNANIRCINLTSFVYIFTLILINII